eukprot:gene10157-18824_t
MLDFYPDSLSADDDSRGSPDILTQDGKVLPYQFEPEYREEDLNTNTDSNTDMRDSGNVDVGRLILRRYHFLEGLDEAVIKRLNRDELGVCAIPTIHAVPKTTTSVAGPSCTAKKRQQRMTVRRALLDSVTDDAGDSSIQQTEVSDEIKDDYYMKMPSSGRPKRTKRVQWLEEKLQFLNKHVGNKLSISNMQETDDVDDSERISFNEEDEEADENTEASFVSEKKSTKKPTETMRKEKNNKRKREEEEMEVLKKLASSLEDDPKRNEAGNSTGMEILGFKRAMEYLQNESVGVTKFISDRHCSIAKCMRAEYKYIDELYQILKKSSKEELEAVALQTKEKIIPPMNRMLDRESKADAIEKHKKRKEMITVDVPATGTVSEAIKDQNSGKAKAAPKCRKCKVPMKGHKCPLRKTDTSF